MRILHFEFDKGFSRKIKKFAEQEGFSYTATVSYDELYREIHLGEFQLLIVNEQVRKLFDDALLTRMTSAKFIYPPIIVITPKNNQELKQRCFDLGIMACFEKDAFESKRFTKYLQTIKKEWENIEILRAFKIAVVDDSPLVIDLIREFFLFHGVKRVDYYTNPEEFLEQSMDYDLFLIDLVMPERMGDDVIVAIRSRNPQGIIILVTAYNNGDILPHCLSLGADDFILKPLDFKLFMVRINSCIERYWLNQELVQKNKKLFDLAIRDNLTGLYSRVYFSQACKKSGREFSKSKKPISFILMDIDYFKNINDEYGHLQGDYVLKEVAAILNRVSRKQDFACRWGGEEFIVMLTNTELEQAVDMAERIRGTIQQQRLKKMKSITASFGVTQWRQNDDEESVFKRLDNSLYLAKLTGRNKVVSNEELQLGYQGKPVSIDWGPFFRCGNRQLDEDHYKLISLANEIIDTCYKEHEKKTISLLFKGLIKDVIAHFAREESLLQQVHYEKVYEHKRVHESLLKGILLVLTKFEAGEITTRVAAQYLVQEIIIGHIIKKDSDFFYLFRSERGAVEIDNEIK